MQIATKTSKNTILPMATARSLPCAPRSTIYFYVISPALGASIGKKLPNAGSHLRVHDLVPCDNIVCERGPARNRPPSRPSAQAPDPRYKRCGNRKAADVIAVSASVAVGHVAMDAAIANYPDQRSTLRNGILVIRQHPRT